MASSSLAWTLGLTVTLLAFSPSISAYNRWQLPNVANLTIDPQHLTFPRSFTPSDASTTFTPADPRCAVAPEPGICRGDLLRFAFNKESQKCASFSWGGCGLAPFDNEQDCLSTCTVNPSASDSLLRSSQSAQTTTQPQLGGPTPLPSGQSNSIGSTKCIDKPCAADQVCKDYPWPVNCFRAPCPQYQCYSKDQAATNLDNGPFTKPTGFRNSKKFWRIKSQPKLDTEEEQPVTRGRTAPLIIQG